jgi:hypothetical protein
MDILPSRITRNMGRQTGKKVLVQASLKLGQPGAQLQASGRLPGPWAPESGTAYPGPHALKFEYDPFENINGGFLGCGTNCFDPEGISRGVTFDYAGLTTAMIATLPPAEAAKVNGEVKTRGLRR